MTHFGRSQGIAQPTRDAERVYRRALRSVGPGYEQDVMRYVPGFWSQHASSLVAWGLFQLAWWSVVGLALYASGFDEFVSGNTGDRIALVAALGTWVLPAIVTLAMPVVWWRRYRAMKAVIG